MTILDVDDAAAQVLEPSRGTRAVGVRTLVPVVAVLAALAVGAGLMVFEDAPPLDVYRTVVESVVTGRFGWRNTLVEATPLLLIGLGLALAYRARVFTIGGEGQYLIGATASVAVVTAPAFADLPGAVLIFGGVAAAAAAGAAWSSISAVLRNRFGTSVVISSLLLNYVAAAVLAWAIRVAIKDPEAFVSQSREIGSAALPVVPGLDIHAGLLIGLALAAAASVLFTRTRWGFLIDVHGHNPDVLDAHETSSRRVLLWVLVACGALAGLAGFIQVAGVAGRLTSSTGVGYGFTAIVVAVLGRLRPVGVLIAAVLLSALTIGFETAERDFGLSASLAGIVQALIVLFVVVGDGVVTRWGHR